MHDMHARDKQNPVNQACDANAYQNQYLQNFLGGLVFKDPVQWTVIVDPFEGQGPFPGLTTSFSTSRAAILPPWSYEISQEPSRGLDFSPAPGRRLRRSPFPRGSPRGKQQICRNLHLAWLPWNRQAKSEILHRRREVQNGETFHKFRHEQIGKLLPKNIAKTARYNSTNEICYL